MQYKSTPRTTRTIFTTLFLCDNVVKRNRLFTDILHVHFKLLFF